MESPEPVPRQRCLQRRMYHANRCGGRSDGLRQNDNGNPDGCSGQSAHHKAAGACSVDQQIRLHQRSGAGCAVVSPKGGAGSGISVAGHAPLFAGLCPGRIGSGVLAHHRNCRDCGCGAGGAAAHDRHCLLHQYEKDVKIQGAGKKADWY